MTEQLDKVFEEVKKLSRTDLAELRSLLDELPVAEPRRLPTPEERRAHWKKHFEVMRERRGEAPMREENIVVSMRREERY